MSSVERNSSRSHPLRVRTTSGVWITRAVLSATGGEPFVPDVPGRSDFRGVQLHSLEYSSPGAFRGKRIVVVGGGNSAAQIVAELTAPESGTYLAWVGTGVALMGFGFVVARFGLFLIELGAGRSIVVAQQPLALTTPIGIALIILGVLVTGFAAVSHARYVAALKNGTFVMKFHSRYPSVLAAMLVVLGAVMAVYLGLI